MTILKKLIFKKPKSTCCFGEHAWEVITSGNKISKEKYFTFYGERVFVDIATGDASRKVSQS